MAGRKLVAVGITLAAISITAGCGGGSGGSGSDPTPAAELHGPALVQQVASALDKADSAHLHGTLSNLQDGGGTNLAGTFDASVTRTSQSGSITTPSSGALKEIILPDKVYLNGDAAFWKSSVSSQDPTSGGSPDSTVLAKLANRWVFAPADSSSTGPGSGDYSLTGLAASLKKPAAGSSPVLDSVSSAQVDGNKVYVISQKDGSKLYVDQKSLLPVRLVNSASSADGAASIDIDDYNAKVSIVAPAGAVSMTTLLGVPG